MKKRVLRFFRFAALVVAVASCSSRLLAADGGEVLWWMISSTDKITGTDVNGDTYTAAQLGVTDARLRYENTDGSSGYLPLMTLSADGKVQSYEGALGVELPGSYFASLGSFTGASYSFVLELGNWSNGAWVRTTMESSVPVSYDDLKRDEHIAEWRDKTPVYSQPWTPSSFSVVPEPTGGVLMLLGTALLALRRRRAPMAS